MKPSVAMVVASGLTWVMLLVAGLARERAWTARGLLRAFGNRHDPSGPSPFAGRADRAAKNMLENLVLFCGLLLAARVANVPDDALSVACVVFVGARLAYAPLYWAGVKYLRTFVWLVSLVGLAWIGYRAVSHLT